MYRRERLECISGILKCSTLFVAQVLFTSTSRKRFLRDEWGQNERFLSFHEAHGRLPFVAWTNNSDFYWYKYLRKINSINQAKCVKSYWLPVGIGHKQRVEKKRNCFYTRAFYLSIRHKYLFLRTKDFVFLGAESDPWCEYNLRKYYNDLRQRNVNEISRDIGSMEWKQRRARRDNQCRERMETRGLCSRCSAVETEGHQDILQEMILALRCLSIISDLKRRFCSSRKRRWLDSNEIAFLRSSDTRYCAESEAVLFVFMNENTMIIMVIICCNTQFASRKRGSLVRTFI